MLEPTLLLNPHQQVLFQHRDNNPAIHFPNYWALWGGHVEDEETPEQAIARELYEEIAYMGHLTWWKTYDFWRSPEVLVHQHLYTGMINTPLAAMRFDEGQAIHFFGLASIVTRVTWLRAEASRFLKSGGWLVY